MNQRLEPLAGGRFWAGFRQEALSCLGQWLAMRTSGSLVGPAGAGKSNLLQYILLYPDRLVDKSQAGFIALVAIDLNHLVDRQPSTLYRLILRTCHRFRARFAPAVAAKIEALYEETKRTNDLFLAQTAVYDLLVAVEEEGGQLVLILDQFDRFCSTASPEFTMALRSLRDSFKESLCYIVGMRQAVIYMPEPEILGDLYHLLDTHICWIGAMSQADTRAFILQETGRAQKTVTDEEIVLLANLTGGYASLLKAACAWLVTVTERPLPQQWRKLLGQHPTIQSRLREIWQGLTQEEKWHLARLHGGTVSKPFGDAEVLTQLGNRGMCLLEAGDWQINGALLRDFVETAVKRGLGRIWQEELTGEIFQGGQRLEGLRPLEEALLSFFLKNPYKPHAKSAIIQHVWPEGTHIEGVTDDSLYQIVRGVRQKIEPDTATGPVYLLTKRGVDEGGYQFFPEGYPTG